MDTGHLAGSKKRIGIALPGVPYEAPILHALSAATDQEGHINLIQPTAKRVEPIFIFP